MLYNKWWKERGTCLAEENARASKTRSLGVENVGGIFVILITGLTLSAIVAVCEFLWKSYQNAQEDKVTNMDITHSDNVYAFKHNAAQQLEHIISLSNITTYSK